MTRRTASTVRTTPAAFTLVELLVVIGIIALLIGILMPTLGRAREASRAATCASNLRQINAAIIMFANDHKGFLPQVGGAGTSLEAFTIDGVSHSVNIRWFGGLYGSPQKFHGPASLLAKYWGTASIAGCPTFEVDDVFRSQYGPVDYAYNSLFARHKEWASGTDKNGLGVRMSRIRRSAEKAVVWDSARLNGATLDRTPWGYPTTGNPLNNRTDPNFHARHNNRGNVGFLDGHVAPFDPAYFPSYNGGQNPALLRQLRIGDIDRDGDQTTNEMYQVE